MARDFAPNAGQVPAAFVVAPQAAQVQDDPTQTAQLGRPFDHDSKHAHGMGEVFANWKSQIGFVASPRGTERDGGAPSRSPFVAGRVELSGGHARFPGKQVNCVARLWNCQRASASTSSGAAAHRWWRSRWQRRRHVSAAAGAIRRR